MRYYNLKCYECPWFEDNGGIYEAHCNWTDTDIPQDKEECLISEINCCPECEE